MKAFEALAAWLASARPLIWVYNPRTAGEGGITGPRTITILALSPVVIWLLYRYWHKRTTYTRSRQSDWTMSLDQDSLTTEHREEMTENGKKLSELHTTESSPYTRRTARGDGVRRGDGDDDVGGGRGQQLLRHQPASGAVTRMQRTTHYTVRDSKQADAMAKNDAESEKKQMEITRSIVNMLASRNSSGE